MITFSLKSGNEIKCEEDNKNSVVKENLTTKESKNQQSSYEAHENYLQKVSEPCEMRGCYDVERKLVTLDTKEFYEF